MEKNKEIKMKSKEYFDGTASIYDKSHDGKFVNVMYDEILERVRKAFGKDVLEVGCGNGNILKVLESYNKYKLSGLDLSENMIIEAKKQLTERVELKVGDAEKLPWEDNKFDIIICNASFHHYPNAKKVLREMKRVLRKEGTLILGDPTAPPVVRQLFNYCIKFSESGDYRIYNRREMEKLLKEEGFEPYGWKKININSFAINGAVKK